uniref:C2H2-type domain-containing protein n=1 Tax=Ciona savignyi TaxID=51511 RepID=H2ZG47_CIOSA
MKLHVRTHTGDELYGCTSCGKKFPYKSSLQTHMILHSGEKSFTCTVCGKSFAQKAHAKEHEASHVGIKRFSCMECQKRFAHKSGLARHISSIHLQYRPFACDICGRTFPLKTKLLEHTRIHTGEKPYVCSLCGLAYKANRSLKKHKKNLHGIEVRAYEVGISKRLRNELRPITTVSSTPILNSNPQQPTIVTVLSPAPPNHNFNTLKMTDVNQNRALQMFLPEQQPMQENLTHTTQEQSSSGNDVPKSLHVMKTLTHCEMIESQTTYG